jgi:hypothetical protein
MLGRAMDGGDDDIRTDAQKEWAEWARSGYAKRLQPTSMRRMGFVFFIVFIMMLVTVFWLGIHGRLP